MHEHYCRQCVCSLLLIICDQLFLQDTVDFEIINMTPLHYVYSTFRYILHSSIRIRGYYISLFTNMTFEHCFPRICRCPCRIRQLQYTNNWRPSWGVSVRQYQLPYSSLHVCTSFRKSNEIFILLLHVYIFLLSYFILPSLVFPHGGTARSSPLGGI